MQSIAIGNIFVVYGTKLCQKDDDPLQTLTFGLSITYSKPRKMQELGNSLQKHMGYIQCPHHSYWACAKDGVESVDKHGLDIMDRRLLQGHRVVFVEMQNILLKPI